MGCGGGKNWQFHGKGFLGPAIPDYTPQKYVKLICKWLLCKTHKKESSSHYPRKICCCNLLTKPCMWLARIALFILYHEIFTNCKLYDASNLETSPHYLMQVHNFTLGDACTNMWLAMSAFFFFCAVNSLPTVNSLKLLL